MLSFSIPVLLTVDHPNIGDLAAIATAIATVLLALVAAFQDVIRSWVQKPELLLSARVSPPDCHKTSFRGQSTSGSLAISCYYFRIAITNEGNTEARDVEVFAASLKQRNKDGNFSVVKTFTPMNLLWSHFRQPFLKVLSPRMPKFCDVAHMVLPNAKGVLGHDLKSVASNKGVLAFDLQVEPNMKGHLVGPGTYRLNLIVAAANALPVEYEIEMAFTGDWYEDEEKMLKDGFQMNKIAGPIREPSFLQKLQNRFEEMDLAPGEH